MHRSIVFFVLVVLHAVLHSTAPEALAPALAATVYLPLWPLSALGLPVFGTPASGGWAGPSVPGWLVVVLIWGALWWQAARLLAWAWRRLAERG